MATEVAVEVAVSDVATLVDVSRDFMARVNRSLDAPVLTPADCDLAAASLACVAANLGDAMRRSAAGGAYGHHGCAVRSEFFSIALTALAGARVLRIATEQLGALPVLLPIADGPAFEMRGLLREVTGAGRAFRTGLAIAVLTALRPDLESVDPMKLPCVTVGGVAVPAIALLLPLHKAFEDDRGSALRDAMVARPACPWAQLLRAATEKIATHSSQKKAITIHAYWKKVLDGFRDGAVGRIKPRVTADEPALAVGGDSARTLLAEATQAGGDQPAAMRALLAAQALYTIVCASTLQIITAVGFVEKGVDRVVLTDRTGPKPLVRGIVGKPEEPLGGYRVCTAKVIADRLARFADPLNRMYALDGAPPVGQHGRFAAEPRSTIATALSGRKQRARSATSPAASSADAESDILDEIHKNLAAVRLATQRMYTDTQVAPLPMSYDPLRTVQPPHPLLNRLRSMVGAVADAETVVPDGQSYDFSPPETARWSPLNQVDAATVRVYFAMLAATQAHPVYADDLALVRKRKLESTALNLLKTRLLCLAVFHTHLMSALQIDVLAKTLRTEVEHGNQTHKPALEACERLLRLDPTLLCNPDSSHPMPAMRLKYVHGIPKYSKSGGTAADCNVTAISMAAVQMQHALLMAIMHPVHAIAVATKVDGGAVVPCMGLLLFPRSMMVTYTTIARTARSIADNEIAPVVNQMGLHLLHAACEGQIVDHNAVDRSTASSTASEAVLHYLLPNLSSWTFVPAHPDLIADAAAEAWGRVPITMQHYKDVPVLTLLDTEPAATPLVAYVLETTLHPVRREVARIEERLAEGMYERFAHNSAAMMVQINDDWGPFSEYLAVHNRWASIETAGLFQQRMLMPRPLVTHSKPGMLGDNCDVTIMTQKTLAVLRAPVMSALSGFYSDAPAADPDDTNAGGLVGLLFGAV